MPRIRLNVDTLNADHPPSEVKHVEKKREKRERERNRQTLHVSAEVVLSSSPLSVLSNNTMADDPKKK